MTKSFLGWAGVWCAQGCLQPSRPFQELSWAEWARMIEERAVSVGPSAEKDVVFLCVCMEYVDDGSRGHG